MCGTAHKLGEIGVKLNASLSCVKHRNCGISPLTPKLMFDHSTARAMRLRIG
jgi:hypothetical protein